MTQMELEEKRREEKESNQIYITSKRRKKHNKERKWRQITAESAILDAMSYYMT